MTRVKDTYVSTEQIKSLEFENGHGFGPNYLVIKYHFSDEPIEIVVDNFEEFVELADELSKKINVMRGA